MSLPGFSAGTSLYQTTTRYRTTPTWGSNSIAANPGNYNTFGLSAADITDVDPYPSPCSIFETLCDGVCTDTSRDDKNCSRCGFVCASYYPQFPDCCDNACLDKKTNGSHCGECYNECGFSQFCCNGICTDIGTHDNCGGCGQRCPPGWICCN